MWLSTQVDCDIPNLVATSHSAQIPPHIVIAKGPEMVLLWLRAAQSFANGWYHFDKIPKLQYIKAIYLAGRTSCFTPIQIHILHFERSSAMPHPQHDALYRRNSVVKYDAKPPISSYEEQASFNDFLRERIDLPEEWSYPDLQVGSGVYEIPRNPPPLAPPFMPSVNMPSPEHPRLPSDWWHNDANVRIVGGTGDLWSGDRIPFFPDHGRCTTGISMQHARLSTGMLHGHNRLSVYLHPFLFNVPHPMLSIQWPGYQSIQESFYEQKGLRPLNLKRPLRFHPDVTLAELAQQVAEYFFEFSEIYGEHCNTLDPRAILLGPQGIPFNRLRMVKLWTSNSGIHWNVEVAIVDDYVK
ncbi:hypothetical protein C8R44DRAFT_760431 [Mycena epipterygia]|nr:hypothetical protein C8R44DRAFT_760431 [Mycena epipterygia]